MPTAGCSDLGATYFRRRYRSEKITGVRPASRSLPLVSLLVLLFASVPAPAAPAAQAGSAVPAPATVRFSGSGLESRVLGAADLATLPRHTVAVQDHGTPAKFEGFDLADILRFLGAPLGESLRGPKLALALVVDAADGYRAVFALAEIDPALGGRRVLLCDRRDGAPLSAHEGPWRIVVEDDHRPARWVRQVVAVDLRAIAN